MANSEPNKPFDRVSHRNKAYAANILKVYKSGQSTILPKPELRTSKGDSLTKPHFGVTSAEVVIICHMRFGRSDTCEESCLAILLPSR